MPRLLALIALLTATVCLGNPPDSHTSNDGVGPPVPHNAQDSLKGLKAELEVNMFVIEVMIDLGVVTPDCYIEMGSYLPDGQCGHVWLTLRDTLDMLGQFRVFLDHCLNFGCAGGEGAWPGSLGGWGPCTAVTVYVDPSIAWNDANMVCEDYWFPPLCSEVTPHEWNVDKPCDGKWFPECFEPCEP